MPSHRTGFNEFTTEAHTEEKHNAFSSTSKLDSKGNFVPCEINQPYAYADHSAKDIGQLVHRVRPVYCERHTELGCTHQDCRN
jgi:hypothetical protein